MTLVKLKNRPEATFNNLVDTLFNGFPYVNNELTASPFKQTAPVNIKENENSYQLDMVAPGLSKEDFKINLEANLLTISFEVKKEAEENTEKFLRKEFKQQSFKRSFTLDENIDAEHINAQYNNGVLSLNLPKKAIVKEAVKQIAIQ